MTDPLEQKAFDSNQLAALLIGATMRLPRCAMCPRFATHSHQDSCGDYACREHVIPYLKRMGFSEERGFDFSEAKILQMGGYEIADRLNCTIWGS